MKKIYTSFTKDLRNYEFYELFSYLDRQLDKVDSDNAILQKAAKKINHHHKQLILLKHAKPGHPLTAIINEKVRTRTEHLAYLRMRIDAGLISYLPQERLAATRLKLWHDCYKKDLHKPSITIQSNLVKGMMHERDEEVDIKEAITLIGLDGLLEAILQLTEEIEKDYHERLREQTYHRTVVKGLREAAYKDLQLLVSTIEVLFAIATEEEEKEEISELNISISNLLRDARTILRSRRTKSKNKRAINLSVEKFIDTDKEIASAIKPDVIYEVMEIGEADDAYQSSMLFQNFGDRIFKLPVIGKNSTKYSLHTDERQKIDDGKLHSLSKS